jgi:hypothetical protein
MMSEAEFTRFLSTTFEQLCAFSRPDSVHYICIDWRHLREFLGAGAKTYGDLLNLCVWVKSNGGMGSLYRSQHELIGVFKNGKARHRNNVELGRHGRNRTNVWTYPGVTGFGRQNEEGVLLSLHPTVKPVALVADAILDCSRRAISCSMLFSAAAPRSLPQSAPAAHATVSSSIRSMSTRSSADGRPMRARSRGMP